MLFNCEYMFDLLAADDDEDDEASAAARLANAAEVVDELEATLFDWLELLLRPLAMLASLLIVSTVDLASVSGSSVVVLLLLVGVAAGVFVFDELKLFAFESKFEAFLVDT